MTSKELVSVIIATYNREKFIEDAILSILNQTYKNIQIIVVDDGSIDETRDIVRKYPIISYHYKKNGGQASARNVGLQYAKGKFVACLDSDDIWYPEFLERSIAKLEEEQLDFVFANWHQEVKDGLTWSFLNNDPFLKPYIRETLDNWVTLEYAQTKNLFLRACPSPSSSVVYRRSSMAKSWDEGMIIGDDWSMYLDIIFSKECKVAFTLDILWRKRVDDMNVYDGRKWNEVLEYLYINDLSLKIIKLQSLLSKSELKILNKRYIESMIELAKHHILREYNVRDAIRLVKRSFEVDSLFTIASIPIVFIKMIKSKLVQSSKSSS